MRATSSFSVSVWVKTSVTETYRYIIGKWWYRSNNVSENSRSWALNFELGNKLIWRGTNNGQDSGEQRITYDYLLNKGVWTHVVGTYDGVQLALYVNGSLVGTKALSSITSTTRPLIIGAGNDGSAFFYNGSLDEISYFNRALSLSEVNAIYQENRP